MDTYRDEPFDRGRKLVSTLNWGIKEAQYRIHKLKVAPTVELKVAQCYPNKIKVALSERGKLGQLVASLSGARVAPGLFPSPTLPRDSPRGQEVKEGYKEEEAPSMSIEVGKLVSGLMRFTQLVCNFRKHCIEPVTRLEAQKDYVYIQLYNSFYFGLIDKGEPKSCTVKVRKKKIRNFRRK